VLTNMRTKSPTARNFARRATALCLAYTQLLMMACASPSQPTEFVAPTPEQQFQLKRGDILRVDVWRQPEFSGEFEISGEGVLVHPLYQEVTVAGLTLPAARQRLSEFLRTYLQGAQLVVEPLSSVTVSGEVGQPNVYHLAWGTTVAEAIGHAGGPTTEAQLDKVRLVRDGSEYELSLLQEHWERRGRSWSMSQELTSFWNVEVVSGDQIFVDRQSQFSIWKDIVVPVSVLASLTLTVILISER
jgi:protein involved in polysaccharide export with SLBB domain